MNNILEIESIAKFASMHNNKINHPLVEIIDLAKAAKRKHIRVRTGLFSIVLKDSKCADIKYGANYYDFTNGTILFFAPGQIIGFNSNEQYQPIGKVLAFHPDFILRTHLAKHIHEYSFFSYEVFEALHTSASEWKIINDCFAKIEQELKHSMTDNTTKRVIISYIELILNYCVRFYNRQFITREVNNRGILERFEKLLNEYFMQERHEHEGLPCISYFAKQLHLSPNYFGDLIKKETGRSALNYLKEKTISIAKEKMFNDNKTISEIAYNLGFKNPQNLSRLFKKQTGYTPTAYKHIA